MTDAAPPEFVYRIITAEDWADALESGVVAYAEIDKRDGFLHLSTREQALETAAIHFSGRKNLLALEIPFEAIFAAVKFEPAPGRGGVLFPHLYGSLAARHVARAIPLLENDDGSFRFGEAES
ncbi:MAG: DUF952 domain-containing protein [Parvularculaceae bacterium]